MYDVMVDIETLGTAPGSVVVSIGAVQFSDDGLGAEFYRTIDVLESLLHGLRVDENTVSWWQTQTAEARCALYDFASRRHFSDALGEFAEFLGPGEVNVWAKGPDFDLVLLQGAYEAAKQRLPWHFRNARDVRTVLAMSRAGYAVAEPRIKHHALSDARYQSAQVLAVYRALGLRLDGTAQALTSEARKPPSESAHG